MWNLGTRETQEVNRRNEKEKERGSPAEAGTALSRPACAGPEVLHSARIYRRKERVRRCRSSVMKGTVI